jgi:hypothetical protein
VEDEDDNAEDEVEDKNKPSNKLTAPWGWRAFTGFLK